MKTINRKQLNAPLVVLAIIFFQLSGNIIALDNNSCYLSRLNLCNKIAEGQFFSGRTWFVEHVEKQDHHQTDNQPE